MSDRDDGSDERPDGPSRPRSVRDEPTPVREGAADASRKGRGGGPVPVRESVAGDRDPHRPVPVRQAMEAEREERQPIEPPTVRIERGDEEWIVRAEGRTTAGFRNDGGAPLLFLTFSRAEDPDERVLETVAVGRRLEAISPGQLGVLLDDARPWKGRGEASELFPETRKNRQSRR